MDSTTMKGTVQGYFDRAFDEMTDKEVENPLANSGLGVKAKLAKSNVLKKAARTYDPTLAKSLHAFMKLADGAVSPTRDCRHLIGARSRAVMFKV